MTVNKYILPNTQAWAFATAARRMMGKSPNMNMLNFDKEVWTIHRKLHHRFLKFYKSFAEATNELEEYKEPYVEGETVTRTTHRDTSPKSSQVVCLLLSDSEGSAFVNSDDSDASAEAEEEDTPTTAEEET